MNLSGLVCFLSLTHMIKVSVVYTVKYSYILFQSIKHWSVLFVTVALLSDIKQAQIYNHASRYNRFSIDISSIALTLSLDPM